MKKGIFALILFGLLLGVFFSRGLKDGFYLARAEDDLSLGEKVYRESCAACHGERGDGNGPQAYRLKTKPRDFTSGIYKFRTTPSGYLPRDQDIVRAIAKGVRGTSMLPQLHLSEKETWAVAQYIKGFSDRFKQGKPENPVPLSLRPAKTKTLIELGRKLFEEAGCATCHGMHGRGNGPSADGLKDQWGYPAPPSDLTLRPFKSGQSPTDLFRTLSTGLDGTPMPSYADVLTAKERWALVYYIFTIATGEKPRGMMGLVGEETLGMMIDMRAAMAGMMGRGGEMMDRNMGDMMKDMMGR